MKFKVGDKVMTRVENDYCGVQRFSVGTIGTVKAIECDGTRLLTVKVSIDALPYIHYWYGEDELMLLDTSNEPIELHNSNNTTRPCMVGDEKAKFHRWADVLTVFVKFDSVLKPKDYEKIMSRLEHNHIILPGEDVTTVTNTFALVEFMDGTVKKVNPEEVRFINKKEA